jgi:hypothetical protein
MLLLLLAVRLIVAWFGRGLITRGENDDGLYFVYRCRASNCGWVSKLLRVSVRGSASPCHPAAGVEQVDVTVRVCATCGARLVYPWTTQRVEVSHLTNGAHRPVPMKTGR